MAFLWWWCFCGGVFVAVFFVVVFLRWCFCSVCVVVFLWLCFCGGVLAVLFLWWCGAVSLWCFCGGVVVGVVVFLWSCRCYDDQRSQSSTL